MKRVGAGGARAASPWRRLALRNRLTLLYTGIMLLTGGVLLALNWLSVRQMLGSNATLLVPTISDDAASGVPSIPAQRATVQAFSSFESAVLGDLVLRSSVILLVLTACAALLGRGMAGRSIGRLERAFAAQREFAAQASHELRTPLTLQRTALEVPLAQGRVPADLEPTLRRALAATTRSEELISSLLALAKGESGTLHPAPADLGHLVAAVLRDVSDEAEARSITVRTELHAAPVEGDVPLLAQLVDNLVSNAVRHNRPGGAVHITTRHDRFRGRSVVTVSNTGVVVDGATMAGLFAPFRRGTPHPGTPRGSGLGLSVVKAVTDAHRGTVEAHGRPDGGLTVTVGLPDRSLLP